MKLPKTISTLSKLWHPIDSRWGLDWGIGGSTTIRELSRSCIVQVK